MLQVRFHNVREIRMGSPYSLCEIRLRGEWVPELPESDWQNIRAGSPDGRLLALVRWDTPGNQPGFRLYVLDLEAQRVEVSDRQRGCCDKLWWATPKRVAWKAFPDLEGEYGVRMLKPGA